jgi:TctA family transporter
LKILPSESEKKVPSEMVAAFFFALFVAFLSGISGGQVMALLLSN